MSGTLASTDLHPVTQLLRDWRGGHPEALDRLLPLVYGELHRLARAQMARERGGHTLQPTALVHEAYLRLVDHRRLDWQGRTHFYAIAATTMRRILVSHARRQKAAKRGGGAVTLELPEDLAAPTGGGVDLLALDEALSRLGQIAPRQSRVVELRYFSGLSLAETAEALQVSTATVKVDWSLARAWLFRALSRE